MLAKFFTSTSTHNKSNVRPDGCALIALSICRARFGVGAPEAGAGLHATVAAIRVVVDPRRVQNHTRLQTAVERGISFLAARQLTHGEFPSLVSAQRNLRARSAPDSNYLGITIRKTGFASAVLAVARPSLQDVLHA
jgi:hypothetical protein